MLLQIDKFSKKEIGPDKKKATMLVDYVAGITATGVDTNKTIVSYRGGHPLVFTHDENGLNIKLEDNEFYKGFKIVAVWLLNDDGKTLRKLIGYKPDIKK